MDKYTIPQKISNTGTIHDIANDNYDRDIIFQKDCKFAVVLSSYYGGKGYTTHKSIGATVKQSKKMDDYSHTIIDKIGNTYQIDFDNNLIKDYN